MKIVHADDVFVDFLAVLGREQHGQKKLRCETVLECNAIIFRIDDQCRMRVSLNNPFFLTVFLSHSPLFLFLFHLFLP